MQPMRTRQPKPRKDLSPLIRRISVSLTEKEYEKISVIAKAAGISMSDVLRRHAIRARLPRTKIERNLIVELQRLRSQVASLGGLIKREYKLNPVYEKETAAFLHEQIKFLSAIQKEFESVRDKIDDGTKEEVNIE